MNLGGVRSLPGRARRAATERLVDPPVRAARRGAGRLADDERVPTALRAVLSYFAGGGEFDPSAVRLRSTVEEAVAGMVEEVFEDVEAALAEEFDVPAETVEFEYETKLLLPAELTLARCYRRARRKAEDGFDPVEREVRPGLAGRIPLPAALTGDRSVDAEFSELVREVDHAEDVTRLVVTALLDGDMRDAINDDEYGDFSTSLSDADPERVAEVAQSTLAERVEAGFERHPDGVRAAYERAVEASEAHQERDPEFRELMETALEADPGSEAERDARERIRLEYRDADFEDPPEAFGPGDLGMPYFRTQFARVGVIYTGMLEMYRAAGIEIDDAFERSVVMAIIGAQVWLDDVDDFAADMREGQLTPVTAEYVIADYQADAYDRVRSVTDEYLDRAREYADESDSALTAIAAEYIDHSGDPGVLPR